MIFRALDYGVFVYPNLRVVHSTEFYLTILLRWRQAALSQFYVVISGNHQHYGTIDYCAEYDLAALMALSLHGN